MPSGCRPFRDAELKGARRCQPIHTTDLLNEVARLLHNVLMALSTRIDQPQFSVARSAPGRLDLSVAETRPRRHYPRGRQWQYRCRISGLVSSSNHRPWARTRAAAARWAGDSRPGDGRSAGQCARCTGTNSRAGAAGWHGVARGQRLRHRALRRLPGPTAAPRQELEACSPTSGENLPLWVVADLGRPSLIRQRTGHG